MAESTPTLAKSRPSILWVTGWTVLFFVLLRVAIGWHFFYEGMWKIKSDGGFSSTPYLMGSIGPADWVFHSMVDDMDGTKKRMTKDYMYEQLDDKYNAILLHYGIQGDSGYQDEDRVAELQKKANGGLTDLQLSWVQTEKELQVARLQALTAKQAKEKLKPWEEEDLAEAPDKIKACAAELERAQKARKDLTVEERAELEQEAARLTKAQVEPLKAFIERKKHGIADERTVEKLFQDAELFARQYKSVGEYVKPGAPNDTTFLTEVIVTPKDGKQDEIARRIGEIVADLDETVKKGVQEESLAIDQPAARRQAQLELLKTAPAEAPAVRAGMSRGEVEALLEDRYNVLRSRYDLTERQHQSKYGWRYRDQKKIGHHDKKNVDYIIDDPDFQKALADYKELLEQIAVEDQKENRQTQFHDQRLAFNLKKRDSLRNALLARVEAPLGDVDLQKIQGFGEYIGPIKDMTQAQMARAAIPDIKEFEFPGNLLKKIGITPPKMTLTYWQDIGMILGLVVVGACLILGLFTRLAALGGVAMLTMFYLSFPPWPGVVGDPGPSEGHYLFVNKNLIELIALLMIATSGIGRWFGLDAFLHAIFGKREQVVASASAPAQPGPDQGRVYVPETRSTARDGSRA
ncbi:MAG: hypothetical protein AMXMBFR13_30790 [Phycisphaerae bacterium]